MRKIQVRKEQEKEGSKSKGKGRIVISRGRLGDKEDK